MADGHRDSSVTVMMVHLAAAWSLGCCVCGGLVLRRSAECRVGRQYLCQASLLLCGLSILALTSVQVSSN